MSLYAKKIAAVQRAGRDHGIRRALGLVGQYAYKRAVRPLMPAVAPVMLAGIPSAFDRKLGDAVLSRVFPTLLKADNSAYEAALVAGLRAQVRSGDTVVVVGGGAGVTACIAARLAGASGSVICYEGSPSGVADIRRTAERNGMSGLIDIRPAVVASAIDVWADRSAKVVPADALPQCDVLELDCEGAERLILDKMTIRPRAIVVETHGIFGAPTKAIGDKLGALGYTVGDLGIAEPALAEVCVKEDIRVLSAVREPAPDAETP